jgi:hypothetical protein
MTLETTIANHGARIKNLEDQQRDHGRKLDRLLWFVITTLVAVLYHMVVQGR